jgi:hypothetical protein
MKIKKRKSLYIPGDYLLMDDLTGRIIRKSQSVKLWNNLITSKETYERRNPQDFLKAMPEREPFKEVRPRNTPFITEPITADDL